MKILFAVSNENVSNKIVDSYQKRYGEAVSFKNVFYFNAIIREIHKDKTYDRIVISEDLEPFSNSNYDVIDKFILERFKEITSGNTIIMGRKTFESLPGVLPNRKHVILTRDKNFSVDNENVEVIHSVDEIINNYKDSSVEAFIIGGGEIYKEFLPHANKLYLTEVLKDFEGDTSFPQVNLENWVVDYSSDILTNAKDGLQYKFIN